MPKLNNIARIVCLSFLFYSPDLKMFRVLAHRWPSVIKSSPVLPLATTSWSGDYASENEGEDLAPPSSGQEAPDGDSEEVHATPSPLTYGKVFGAIPRMTKAINTPTINQRISAAFGLPALSNSEEFKKLYSSGREALR